MGTFKVVSYFLKHHPKFIIPFALFIAHYRLKKRFLYGVYKENSRAILLYIRLLNF